MFHNVRDAAGKFARKDGGVSTPKAKKAKVAKVAAPVPSAPPVPASDVGTTLVAFVLDSSGSMAGLEGTVMAGFNSMLDGMKQSFRGQQCLAMVQTFNYRTEVVQYPVLLEQVRPISRFNTGGGTALFQSVRDAINSLRQVNVAGKVAYLIVTMTDGEENASYGLNIPGLVRECVDLQNTGVWTFAYQVPRGAADRFAANYQVPRGNVTEWEATRLGTQSAFQQTNSAVMSFANSRAAGQTAVASFYVTTDLSKVGKQDLAKLNDIGTKFKQCTVDKEVEVKDFVERKTKAPYIIGQAYYQLMKKEKVQPQKAVLIKEKTGTAIYGGQEARSLIGLPPSADAIVTPGNHANYDIFVQSTSVNRKLPRGTVLLVDVTQNTNLPHTW